jgi:hypothetical protein
MMTWLSYYWCSAPYSSAAFTQTEQQAAPDNPAIVVMTKHSDDLFFELRR